MFYVKLCFIVCALPHGLYVLLPMTKTHKHTAVHFNVKQALGNPPVDKIYVNYVDMVCNVMQ